MVIMGKIFRKNYGKYTPKPRTISDRIRNARTMKDLTPDEHNAYVSKYGIHGTLHRTKKKSIRAFLGEYYGIRA